MVAMNINSPGYVLSGSASSASITLTPSDANQTSGVFHNTDSTYTCFIVTGTGAKTAAFPASATSPTAGKAIGPGMIVTFTKTAGHETIAAIWDGAATGKLYAYVGAGE